MRRISDPKIVQPKAVVMRHMGHQAKSRQVAPLPYKPQPTPKVLQTKMASSHQSQAGQTVRRPAAPPVYKPKPNSVAQPKTIAAARKPPTAPPIYVPKGRAAQAKMGAAANANRAAATHPGKMRHSLKNAPPQISAITTPAIAAPTRVTRAPLVKAHPNPVQLSRGKVPGAPRLVGSRSRVAQLTKVVNVARTQTILQDSPGGKAAGDKSWMSRFDVDIRDQRVVVTIRLKAAIESGLFQSNWRQRVADKWSNRFMIRAKDKDYPIEVNLELVTMGQHYDITAKHSGKAHDPHSRGHFGTEHMLEWGAHDVINVPHEVGHMLGNVDEYGKVRFNGKEIDYIAKPSDTIMAVSENNPIASHYYLIEWAAKEEMVALGLIAPTDVVTTLPDVGARHATAVAHAGGPTQSELLAGMSKMLSKPTTTRPVVMHVEPEPEPEFMSALKNLRKTGSSASATAVAATASPADSPPSRRTPATAPSPGGTPVSPGATPSGAKKSPPTAHVAVATVTSPTSAPPPTKATAAKPKAPERALTIGRAGPAGPVRADAAAERLRLHNLRVQQITAYVMANIETIPAHLQKWFSENDWNNDPDVSARAKVLLKL